jgi:hypothetical protein
MSNQTAILEKRVINGVTAILASVKLYNQPYRKHSGYPTKKRRRGGIKTGYFVYLFTADNPHTLYKSFGYRILTYRKAKKFYEICCSNAKHTKLVDQYILPLWSACNCKEAIYERRSHIDILKYFGNKDFFPTFYTLLSENNLIQNEETISDKQN